MKAIHRSYEGEVGARKQVLYVAENGECERLAGAKAASFLKRLGEDDKVLFTSGHSADAVLLELASRNVPVFTAHWHSTGVSRNLAPEKIAVAFSALPDDSLRPFVARPDLAELRMQVRTRHALLEYRKAAILRLSAVQRDLNTGRKKSPEMEAAEGMIDEDRKNFETPVDRKIAELARKIPDCMVFNRIAGVADGMMTAATVVSYCGDISRFPRVSSFWHFCGFHVVDGKAPKRKAGTAQDWNGKVRTALWSLGQSIIKNRNNPWRAVYDALRAEELGVHDRKCGACGDKLSKNGYPLKETHSNARAIRRVIKEILKAYYVEMSGRLELAA